MYKYASRRDVTCLSPSLRSSASYGRGQISNDAILVVT